MAVGHAIVTILAALILLLGSTLAVLQDRRSEIADGRALPMYLSNLSQALNDARGWPRWIFLIAATIWAPLVLMSTIWLAEATMLEPLESPETSAREFRRAGYFMAFGGYAMAAVPMGTLVGLLSHLLTSSMFAGGGLTIFLASDAAFTDELSSFRQALTVAMYVCLGLFGMAMPIGMYANGALNAHRNAVLATPPAGLESYQVRRLRLMQLALATGQGLLGFLCVLGIITAAFALNELESSRDNDAVIAGAVAFSAMLVGDVLLYAGNRYVFLWCQSNPISGVNRNFYVSDEEVKAECWKYIIGGFPKDMQYPPPKLAHLSQPMTVTEAPTDPDPLSARRPRRSFCKCRILTQSATF